MLMTPIGPMSDFFMISRALSGAVRDPRPSAVSATPSRWKPPVAPASQHSASTPASNDPAPSPRTRATIPPATAPRHSPSQGNAVIARRASERSMSLRYGPGRIVKRDRASATPRRGPSFPRSACRSSLMPTSSGLRPHTSTPRRRPVQQRR